MSGAWDTVTGLLGFGDPSGNDHGSSNWAAWGHPEIRDMLDQSVDPTDIGEAAQAWRDQARNDAAIVGGLTSDLQQTVSGGWRGASADAALAPLGAISQWAASHIDIADHTSRLMADSGSAAAQAKASVPPPKSHSWTQTLAVTALTGPVGGITDAVMQEQAQSDAHAEAVRIMTNVYSAPINDHRVAVPTYLQMADPTLQPPDQAPVTGPAPGIGYSAPGVPAAGAGGHIGAHHAQPPAAVELQGVTSGGGAGPVPTGGQMPPDQAIRGPQHGSGQAAAAAAGVPIAAAGDTQRARAAGTRAVGGGHPFGGGRTTGAQPSGGAHLGGRHSSGIGRTGAGHAADFGPRPSSAAAEVAAGRADGLGRGAGAAAAGRAGPGGMMAPVGAAGSQRGEDSEHRRPSYLIEMEDIFSDGRKVAPAVIGEDPPGQGGS